MERLRFKDENGNEYPEWKKVKLGNLCNISTGKYKPSSDMGNFIIMDMGSVNSEGKILNHKLTDDNSDILEKGSLVMPKDDIGGGLIICKTAYIPEDNKYVLGDHVYKLFSSKCNTMFLHFRINSVKTNRSLKMKVTGSAQLGINSKNIAKEEIMIPSLLPEQGKIGGFLSAIDRLVDKQKEKVDLLKEVKKGYLQKMFPKKDQKNPEVRFEGFTDAWEQCELGELADIVGGGTPSTAISEYWNGTIDWYSPVEIGGKVYVDGSQNKITLLGLEKSSAKILPKGTVLFTSRAGIGKSAILAKQGSTNQGFQSLLPKTDMLDSYFIYSRTGEIKRYSETVGAGSTFIEVSGKQLSKMEISVPDIKEQIIIGSYFEKIDNLITLHQRKFETYELMKKGYMQRLFT